MKPELSVIMPVYNAQQFLREAIDSILQQTFRDFELIIINDGSSDKSEDIILSYRDSRIKYVKNDQNLGLIKTLNKAIVLCSGAYIARMDNDDISDVTRFEKQLTLLKNDPDAGMVCSPIIGITSGGKTRDHWPADFNNRTPESIRKTLPRENCISHPTILARADLMRKYMYSPSQKGSEDWDLWLRFERDGVKIIKTDEVLVKYRIHGSSMTLQHKSRQSAQVKSALVKFRFVCSSIGQGKINAFVLRTFIYIFKDLAYHIRKTAGPRLLKKTKWLLTINPLTAWRQYKIIKEQLQLPSAIFLFFPYSHIGGAEKVHAQITTVVEEKRPLVFFTGLNDKSGNLTPFGKRAILIKAAAAIYHPFFAAKTEYLIREKINSTSGAVVFGANNRFFYQLILGVKPEVMVADLTHDVDLKDKSHTSESLVNSVMRCNRRIFISNKAIERTRQIYDNNFVDDIYYSRLQIIYNFVETPPSQTLKKFVPPFRVLYVGRDTPEKAVERVFQLAKMCSDAKLQVQFTLVGDIKTRSSLNNIVYKGVVLEKEELSKLYQDHHFVIITSKSEGFPLSIMEGMVQGCIPIATAVGDIPFHISAERGFLAESNEFTPETMLKIIQKIFQGDFGLDSISENCRRYATTLFNYERFKDQYLEIFNSGRTRPGV